MARPGPAIATSGIRQLGHLLGVDFERHAEAEDFAWPGVELVSDGVEVIYNGIDPGRASTPADRAAARQTLGLPPEALVVGTVARLDPRIRLSAGGGS